MYINLIDKLSALDKKRIENYIYLYGTSEHFIGIDKWLASWSHSNQKLYHLLGDQLIVKEPIRIEKNETILAKDISIFLEGDTFWELFNIILECKDIYLDLRRKKYAIRKGSKWFSSLAYDREGLNEEEIQIIENEIAEENCFEKAIDYLYSHKDPYIHNKYDYLNVKIKGLNVKKTLQIQNGTKPLKVVKRILDFLKEDAPDIIKEPSIVEKINDLTWDQLYSIYYNVTVELSQIFNDKILTGDFCISIHPLDFMTMSDNSLSWTSCMNWTDRGSGGCYHIGTVEMMNSNNVVCCYVESNSNRYYFDTRKDKQDFLMLKEKTQDYNREEYCWNNKKYRVLGYVNKNIIMSGKPYPYYHEELSLKAIKMIKTLAEKNLNWKYQYGPELYLDMIHINSAYAMENNKLWIKHNHTTKKNIIWDTKGMYNDMLNDNNTRYWCFRNPVKHNIVYSVSGKAPCMCCGGSVLKEAEDYEYDYDYNERFSGVGRTVCEDCDQTYFHCDYCNDSHYISLHFNIKTNTNSSIQLCSDCAKMYVRKCPCCGELYLINDFNKVEYPCFIDEKESIYNYAYTVYPGYNPTTAFPQKDYNTKKLMINEKNDAPYIERVLMCKNCFIEKYLDKVKNKPVSFYISFNCFYKNDIVETITPIVDIPIEEASKFFLRNQPFLSMDEFNKDMCVKESCSITHISGLET